MKKIFLLIFTILFIISFSGCSQKEVKVTFYVQSLIDENKFSEYKTAYDNSEGFYYHPGDYIDEPIYIDYFNSEYGYTFSGWFTDRYGNNAWNFYQDKIETDTNLYGLWIPDPE